MRKLVRSGLVLTAAAGLVFVWGGDASGALPNPVSYWTMNEGSGTTAADTGSPGGYPGTLVGGCTWGTGIMSGALQFDGSTGYVQCTGGPAPQTAITVAAWMKHSSTTTAPDWGNGGIVSRGGGWGWDGYSLWRLNDQIRVELQRTGAGGMKTVVDNPAPSNDAWHHIAFTWDGTTIRTYIDAELQPVTGTFTGNLGTPTVNLTIGVVTNGNGQPEGFFEGLLDDARVYDVALSQSEIEELYNLGSPSAAPTITRQPTHRTTYPGGTATYTIASSGSVPRTYQWQVSTDGSNWTDIAGATSTSYTTPVAALADNNKRFRCKVTNNYGSVESDPAMLHVREPALLGHWSFDNQSDPFADDSGKGRNGTPYGGPTWTAQGKLGGAMSFDGTDDWIQVGAVGLVQYQGPSDLLPAGRTARTICGWARAASGWNPANWTGLFGFMNTAGQAYTFFDIETSGAYWNDVDQYLLHIYGSEWVFRAVDTEWHHFAAVYDETEIRGYLDGALMFRVDGNGAGIVLNTLDNWVMGRRQTDNTWFNGLLDDIRVYDGVVKPADLADIMRGQQVAPKRYWVGGSGNWTDTSHWSYSSGGAGGAPVPTAAELAVFDANSGSGTCTVNAAATALGISMISPGLVGRYYDGDNPALEEANFVQELVDASINFPSDSKLVLGARANSADGNNFSIRWTGKVRADATGNYVFRTVSDDGARLWVDNMTTPIVDAWVYQAPTAHDSAPIALTAGQWYDIKLEFMQGGGGAAIQLFWQRPGESSFEIIPEANLSTGQSVGITISQGANNITLGAGGFVQNAGTFTGGTGTLSVAGPFSLHGGSFTCPSMVAFTGTTTMTVAQTLQPLVLNNVVIASGGALTATSGQIDVAGNWTNDGTFVHNGGTVRLTGASATIGGTSSTAFNNLTVGDASGDTATFNASASVAGTLLVPAGVSLLFDDAVALTLLSGSTFQTQGTSSFNPGGFVRFAGAGSGDYYSVELGGNVSAQWVEFQNLAATGLKLSSPAGSSISLSNVNFRSSEGGADSTHLLITGAAANGLTFTGFSFEGTDVDDPTYAVAINCAGATVTFANYDTAGNRIFGNHFDRDADGNPTMAGPGLVNWTGQQGPTPGAFDLTSPADGAHLPRVQLDLQWSPSQYAESYTVKIYSDSGLGTLVFQTTVATTHYQLQLGDVGYETQYWWKVTASSAGVTVDSTSTRSFTAIDTDPPSIVNTSPDATERHVPCTTAIRIVFSERMSPTTTIPAFSLTLGGQPVAGTTTLSADGLTLTFTPSSDLEYGKKYYVTVAATATDAAATPNALGADYTFYFTVEEMLPGLGANANGCGAGAGGAALAFGALAAAALLLRRRLARPSEKAPR